MKRTRFTKEQIIAVLKEAEAGAKTGDLARRHGVSEATSYNWKAKMAAWRYAFLPPLRSCSADCRRSATRLSAESGRMGGTCQSEGGVRSGGSQDSASVSQRSMARALEMLSASVMPG